MNTNNDKNKGFFDSITVNLTAAEVPEFNPNRIKKQRDAWVAWGNKNDYPDQLIKSVKKSTLHQSFINAKQRLITSEGLTYSDDIKEFVEKINEYGESLDVILENVASDLSVLETCAIAVRYNRLKDKIVALDYIDSSKVRVDKNLDEFGRVQGYWISADWSNIRENLPVYFEAFNPTKKGKETTQVFYYRKRTLGQPYYPEVSYAGALNYVESAFNLSVFLSNTISNGFYSSAIVEINSEATADDKRKFIQEFTQKNTGSENAGKVTFIWTSQPNSIKINPVNPSDITTMLNAARKICTEEITQAHGGQSIIVGVAPEGSSLGSDGKMYNTSMRFFYDNIIRRYQKPVLDFFKSVLDFNGHSEYELEIKSSALLMDEIMMQDLLKPESYISDYGYDVEDLLSPSEPPEQEITESDSTDEDGTTTPEGTPEDSELL